MEVLEDKTYKSYNYTSRYNGFPYYYQILDKKYTYGTTANLKDSSTYTLYKVNYKDTYDSIALDFYNTPLYFWIICDFNRIQDPFEVPTPGTYLKIPSISNISYKNN